MANRFSQLLKLFGKALRPVEGDSPGRDGGYLVSTQGEHRTDAVSRVYAQALLELAGSQPDAMVQEAQGLLELMQTQPDLRNLLSSRALNSGQRSSAVDRLFKGNISDTLYRLLQVMNRKDRLGSLEAVLNTYLALVAQARGEVDVDVFVAEALSQSAGGDVAESIGSAVNKKVRLRQHVDPELIGGLKVRVGDRLIDGSVATQLRIIKRRLVDAGRESARTGGLLEG